MVIRASSSSIRRQGIQKPALRTLFARRVRVSHTYHRPRAGPRSCTFAVRLAALTVVVLLRLRSHQHAFSSRGALSSTCRFAHLYMHCFRIVHKYTTDKVNSARVHITTSVRKKRRRFRAVSRIGYIFLLALRTLYGTCTILCVGLTSVGSVSRGSRSRAQSEMRNFALPSCVCE